MKRTIAAAALVLGTALLGATLSAAALPAAAQGPATIGGRVYACASGAPVGHAAVRLRGLDDGATIVLTSDAGGRFVRVGLAPGRYLIEASAPPPAQPILPGHWLAPTASRLARVETDDVLDLRIGTDAPERFYGVGPVRRPDAAPHPACDDPLVPVAVPMVDRYIIR
jgi:hypothetical protein